MTTPSEDDDFLFEDEDEDTSAEACENWVMLIVDDEPGIHDVTKLALRNFSYEGRGLDLISAFSGQEALDILQGRDDVAVILLDVVMENDHAGLDCARQIRDDLGNDLVRIVLRTGQPGQAPEQEVILGYDINDYRAKTELSAERLFTTVISALRSYRDIKELERFREDAFALLAQNTQTIQTLIDMSETPLLQLCDQQNIQRCNQAFATVLGKEIKELIGQPLRICGSDDLVKACNDGSAARVELNAQTYRLAFSPLPVGLCVSLHATV